MRAVDSSGLAPVSTFAVIHGLEVTKLTLPSGFPSVRVNVVNWAASFVPKAIFAVTVIGLMS